MKYSAGFIGVGNMGGALASAVYRTSQNIALCDTDAKKTAELNAVLKNASPADIDDAARNSKFLFLAVKPDAITKVAQSIKDSISPDTVVVTIAAGVTLAEAESAIGSRRCIRIMPNTAAAVGEGMILYCCASGVSADEEKAFLELMSSAGVIDKLDESLFDAAAALSGCGPAYVYIFAQALADGAVACGVPRDKAALYAAQTVYGAAAMLKNSGRHPEKLKDEVCSPGGTTIAGVLALEEAGFRAASAKAVISAFEKTAKLKK